ncbi:MAG: M50 family metallopeptidase, partial [Mycobacteriales bacterium]
MTLVGILAFVVALLLSVMLHEAGHFFTARHYGMKATQFFVGFGPTLWSRQRGETEYGIKAVPAGGFVKIVGMTPLEQVEAGDEDRAFYKQPWRRKTVVLAAGSTVHFLICVALLFGTVAAFGVPDGKAPVLSAPQPCLVQTITSTSTDVPSGQRAEDGSCPAGTVPGVAAAAGLRAGDRVLSVDGRKIADYDAFRDLVRASAGKALSVVVQRGSSRVTLALTPRATTRPDL